jgi:pilus assembly protein Flp/PilA
MQRLTTILREFVESDDGATAMEYALLAGLIAAVIVLAVSSVGIGVSTLYTFVADQVAAAAAVGGS